jgi:hypothetical protein
MIPRVRVAIGFIAVCILLAASVGFGYEAVATSGVSTPTPTPEVVVLGSTTFVPHKGSTSIYLVGEVRNDTHLDAEFVRIDASLRDASGEVVYAKHSYSKIGILAPGATSPFLIIFSDLPEWASYDLAVVSRATARQLYPLEVLSSELSLDDDAAFHVMGKVKNQYDEQCKFIQAYVTLYDANGEVIGTDSSYATPSDLNPGRVAFFDTRIYFWKHKPDAGKVASHRLQVYGTGPPQSSQIEQTPIGSPIAPSPSAGSFPWGWVFIGILGFGALGVGGYKLMPWAIRRTRLKRQLKVLRARTSNLLNACEPLLRGDTPEETVLYQLFGTYGGEQSERPRKDVYEWLRRSQDALNVAFDLRRKLIASEVQEERSLEQQVYDWEMLYVTFVGNSERILSLTNDELHTLLDPILVLDRETADVQLIKQLDDIWRELASGMPLKVDLMMVDPSETDAEGILGYIDRVKDTIAGVRDKGGNP